MLPSYYQHLADGADSADGPAVSTGGGDQSGEIVYGPHGPDGPVGSGAFRAGLGAHRAADGGAAERGGLAPAAQPPAGELPWGHCVSTAVLCLSWAMLAEMRVPHAHVTELCWNVCRHVIPGRVEESGAAC